MLPNTESLKDTVVRVLPFWYDYIAPTMLEGKKPLVVAHGNSLRGIIKHLNKISDEGIKEFIMSNSNIRYCQCHSSNRNSFGL